MKIDCEREDNGSSLAWVRGRANTFSEGSFEIEPKLVCRPGLFSEPGYDSKRGGEVQQSFQSLGP